VTSVAALSDEYGLAGTLFRVRVAPQSSLVGRSIEELQIRRRFAVNVVGRHEKAGQRARRLELSATPPWTRFEAGDVIDLHGRPKAVADFVNLHALELLTEPGEEPPEEGLGLVEVLLTPESSLIGRTLDSSGIREKFRVTVLAVRRMGVPLGGELASTPLRFGDTLLVKGAWGRIQLLDRERRDFVVTRVPREMERAIRPYRKAPWAIGIVVAMMLLMTFGIVPAVFAVLLAAAAMVLMGAVDADAAYRSINWTSVVLIAATRTGCAKMERTALLCRRERLALV
jgi:uncharacterized protein with PhoU and TrkA domain